MKKNRSRGQALITILFITVIAITIGASAAVVATLDARSTQRVASGTEAYYIAESGIENAMLRLLRDPEYKGETLLISGGSAKVTVSITSPKTVTSTGTIDNYQRTIQTIVGYNNGVFTITSWKEIPSD
jgi:Tfp pilus assembly protein PilX